MRITVLYFAAVRDLVGKAEEELDVPDQVVTIRALADHLATRHARLQGRLGPVRFAKNEEFVTDEAELTSGDVVALIPPVAGG
jgi:molybdopterin converting factor subunit 1